MKRILTVAGSDSGGGAGIQADLKTITVLGGHAMSAVTALTAQNTLGIQGVYPVPVDFIRLQMESVIRDIGVDVVKTGMLATDEIVDTVVDVLRENLVEVIVVDPVMVAKSGDRLLSDRAVHVMKERLISIARLVTPNLSEAEVLSGIEVKNLEGMKEAAKRIHDLGARFVLIKGGHLRGKPIDVLFDGEAFQEFEAQRISSKNTHGTGCTLSAAVATFLAEGRNVAAAVASAKQFITRAIALGIPIGKGHGPTNPYSEVLYYKEKEKMRREMEETLALLLEARMARLIPEVRSNLCYALPGALSFLDVLAVPGRISTMGDRLVVYKDPAFGASRHMARVVLAAMKRNPEMRSAMNIKYSKEVISACMRTGMTLASFDRGKEPISVKAREGASLDWGTEAALKSVTYFPDAIYDKGDFGKEPMVRVLGRNPSEVANKVIRIAMASA